MSTEFFRRYANLIIEAEGDASNGFSVQPDEAEYDQEGDYAKNQIHTIIRCASELEKHIGDEDNLPEWCQEKLANIKGMMVQVTDYLISEEERGEEKATGQEMHDQEEEF